MIRTSLIIFLALLLGACASFPEEELTVAEILTPVEVEDPKSCPQERRTSMNREWNRYEGHGKIVVQPNWRMYSNRWARIECQIGHPIRQFHPPRR